MVAGAHALGVQSGLHVLQNGGTAADACVASAAVGALLTGFPTAGISIDIVAYPGRHNCPLAIHEQSASTGSLLAVWHSLLKRYGHRSLYDIALDALRYATHIPDLGTSGEPVAVSPTAQKEARHDYIRQLGTSETLRNRDDGHLWRAESAGLSWVERAPKVLSSFEVEREEINSSAQLSATDVQTLHAGAVDHWGMGVSMILTSREPDDASTTIVHFPSHYLALSQGEPALLGGQTGRGHGLVLSRVLSNILAEGMGVQAGVEAAAVSHRSDDVHEEVATTIIAIDRTRGLLVGGQSPGKNGHVVGY
jgi:gamma-glutamyltranspeptidase